MKEWIGSVGTYKSYKQEFHICLDLPIFFVTQNDGASLVCCIALTDKTNAIFLRKVICSSTVSELFSSLNQKCDIPRSILVIALFIRV